MTDQEIKDQVESWNLNLNIFEIYDEVKDMQYRQDQDLSRLLNHAYEYFKYDSTMAELMTFLGVEIAEESLCGEHKVDLTTTS